MCLFDMIPTSFHSSRTNNFRAPVSAVASIRTPAMATRPALNDPVRLSFSHPIIEGPSRTIKKNRNQSDRALVPYGAGEGSREETLKEFIAAVS
jgi:hypothetical protein